MKKMIQEEDITILTHKGFVIEAEKPIEKMTNLQGFTQNQLIYLENNRFLKTEFVKFPDEQRKVHYQNQTYEIFGKSAYLGYFALDENQGVFFISKNDEFELPVIEKINENLKNFTMIYCYFLSSMYEIIAQTRAVDFKNEQEAISQLGKIFDMVSAEFQHKAQALDKIAFKKNKPSFWQMVVEMMQEASLSFTFHNVSVTDYIATGRWKN